MSSKFTTARMTVGSDHFEILVKPNLALDYKLGKTVAVSQILAIDEIYADASKGTRASVEKLQKLFGATDPVKVAEEIMRRGELQLTTEQRRQLVEEKRKSIIAFISRNCIDPRTGAPHPPLRIEQALAQIRLSIDPFKSAEEQSKDIIDMLRPLIPIKMEQMRVAVKIPADYAAKAYGAVKSYAVISREEWQSDGSWAGTLEMPAGLYGPFIEKLGKLTQGTIQLKLLK
ncbi:MAG: ribosome assembly factor SBDS [Candidatus Bathyarchaeota archaeon]|jgi:ribosome maturation protein SDO1|nr:ribosome assembly factor SBDS [Candidatus Bathyarchaeota archaeon]